MTIVAGFKCSEGIVLCADTQETVGESKRNVPKLRFEPADKETSGAPDDELAVAFCGATSNGVFMDEMVDRAWEDIQTATSLDEACDSIKASVKNQYKEAVHLYQVGYCPEVELIYGVKMHGSSRLFYSLGPAVTEREKYASGGKGLYLADFLASRMQTDYLSLRQSMILAAYILFQAKENVDGCGGDSHVAVLRNDGLSGRVDWHRIQTLSEHLKLVDHDLGEMALYAADLHLDSRKFKERCNAIIDLIDALRIGKKNEIKDHDDMIAAMFPPLAGPAPESDEFGLPRLSDDQKSEPEP